MTHRCYAHLRRSLRILLLGSALIAGRTAAVAGQEIAESGRVPASLEFHLGVTRLADVAAGQAGVAALLDLGPIRVGGGAWGVLRRIDVGSVLGGSGLELSMGYGGALVEYPILGSAFSTRLLAGGGAATLRTLAVGARFDTETFVVLEPSVAGVFGLLPAVSLGGQVGYRWVHGADALFLVGNSDLRGGHAAVFLRLGTR